MTEKNLLQKRPAETSSSAVAVVVAIVVGILNEVAGIQLGPYTIMGLTLLVGLVAPGVTWLVERSRS